MRTSRTSTLQASECRTSGVVEAPIAHGAALAWAGVVRAEPDPLVLHGRARGDCWRAPDIRCRRAAHRTRRRPGLGRRCGRIQIHWFFMACLAETAGGRSASGVVEPPIAHGAAPAWAGEVRADLDEVQEVHDADVPSLNAAGFEVQ